MNKSAVLSECGQYRYALERSWGEGNRGFVHFIMLNPSTADASIDDHTIRKCMGFAQRWGAEGIYVTNLFALRSTNPDALYSHPDPVGPENDDYLLDWTRGGEVERVIAGWGKHGKIHGRADKVLGLLRDSGVKVEALLRNDDGSPRHPLYVPYSSVPVVMT